MAGAADSLMFEETEDRCVAPPHWSRLLDLKWMRQAQAQQELVDTLVMQGRKSDLLQQHPNPEALMSGLQATRAVGGAEDLRRLHEQALGGATEVAKITAIASTRMSELLSHLEEQNPTEVSDELDNCRNKVLDGVASHSKVLMQLDPLSDQTPIQMLAPLLGQEHVERMTPEARYDKVDELRLQRIAVRQETAQALAKKLLDDGGCALAVDIATEDWGVEQQHTQASLAEETRENAQGICNGLRESLREQEDLLKKVKAQKLKATEVLNRKRGALVQALRAVEACSAEYDHAYLENEILRCQGEDLESGIDATKGELEAVDRLRPETEAACEDWRAGADEQVEALQQQHAAAAARAVKTSTTPLVTAALNLEVSLELLGKVRKDKQDESASLEQKCRAKASEVDDLKELTKRHNTGNNYRKLMAAKQRLVDLKQRIDACHRTLEGLNIAIPTAESRRRSLQALSVHGLDLQEADLALKAESLVEQAYPTCLVDTFEEDEPETGITPVSAVHAQVGDAEHALVLANPTPATMQPQQVQALVQDVMRAMRQEMMGTA